MYDVSLVCEKHLVNGKNMYFAVRYLEKHFDSIGGHDMWPMLRVYGVGSKL